MKEESEANVESSNNDNHLFDYMIIFDDVDKGKDGIMKRINKQRDSHDAIMFLADELEKNRRSAFIRKIYTIH